MEIRFNVVKKDEQDHRRVVAVPYGHPRVRPYSAGVNLDGTPDLVLELFDEINKFIHTKEAVVIV